MKYQTISAALAVAALSLGAANLSYAQSGPVGASRGDAGIVTNLHKADDKDVLVKPFNLKVRDVEDANLIGADGKKIGEIDNLLADQSGQIVAATADIGGFLGIGRHEA